MPIFMKRDPPAGCTIAASTAATGTVKTRTRRGNLDSDRLPAERDEQPPEPFLEIDLRLPAEQLTCAGDVRLANLRIVDREGLEDDLALGASDLANRLGQLEQRHLGRVADVDRQVLTALGEQDDPADEVVDVAEAPCLRAVAEDRQRLVRERLPHEGRNRPT